MEIFSSHKTDDVGVAVKEEKNKVSTSKGDDESWGEEIVLQVGAGKRVQDEDGMKAGSPNKNILQKGILIRSSPESESRWSSSAKLGEKCLDIDQLESTKAEMDELMEENQRLKMYIDQTLKDYRTLQMQYRDIIQQGAEEATNVMDPFQHDHIEQCGHEPVDLSLGISSRERSSVKENACKMGTTSETAIVAERGVQEKGLALGLDCKFGLPMKSSVDHSSKNPSPQNSMDEVNEESEKTWRPKTEKNTREHEDIDDILEQNPSKRARVSVRVRCDTPTMNDGCQWRKYGQKIAKGNPCPRAYYRCTVALSCPVRKQVQRCAEDMSILITTYEGTHNHPLPMSATTMASTTSAAASMLLSGSSTSKTFPSSSTSSISSTTTTSVNLNGLNFYLSNNSRTKPYYLPNSSISSTHSHPTITLDLTSNSSSSSSHLSRLGNFPPKHSATNLNFNSLDSNPPAISWSNGMLSYTPQCYNKSQPLNSLNFGAQHHETLFRSYLQTATPNPSQQPLPSDTIAAATKAITSNPSFHSALAAALTSIMGSGSANQNLKEKSSHIIANKESDYFPILSSFPSIDSNVDKSSTNLINKSSSSTSSQPTESMLLSPPFGGPNSKDNPNSPSDKRDYNV